jgi:hypothetical protein
MSDSHTQQGQIARAKRIEEALEHLQKGEPLDEPASTRERLERAAAEFKGELKKKEESEGG